MSGHFTHAFDIAVDHPCFAGHFPGFPVLPAVAQFSLLTEALSILHHGQTCVITSIPVAKFLCPIRPGTTVTVELRPGEANSAEFALHCSNTVATKGKLTFTMIAA
ncbi:MAG: hypothetical protein COW19_09180 [Zetaproteobacteria bacterium CG12_big_fil_rev_8_21_14_0_65_55_1124]|nr:MAG: hypothetical protein AUJ58_04950 [Zetaproteobacteria bacterium CG1_02_55_237]PIS18633.1 MAG: hypothetical protein COT53_09895 [Zetaproteobacteria bacterium CG08_land_8_20_14_0_20_55_17]PIW42237.1 MAG: hypothetical protein COW19_09180 [Zetaproteobacteria bacterium CG12_big_fil_rev_8_21_14_0_65_55_1124]PIY51371.1 MAG: hypothetical protein COZ01_11395 [Zetaproteobacteria bacterium CG_4_10_14_0_8_um_filter_55_43]PIZ38654.1 MAG: hypothetical protein COY36_05715 [Zetaproteobacteria bacterium 